MKTISTTLKVLTCAAFILAIASFAQAQTRTWVSGVGDDLNPCSRTAPCKTFAGAISKTADKGEIDCLDPGGFGTVTITKNITIDGTTGAGFGSILASGTNGVNVNDSATATPNTILVKLRNLSINGASTGFSGVRFISGRGLQIEGCTIFGFKGNSTNSHGIDVTVGGGQSNPRQYLSVKDSNINQNTGSGLHVNVAAFGVNVVVDNSRFERNQNGVFIENNANLQMTNSIASLNTGSGVHLTGTVSANLTGNSIDLNNNGLVVLTTSGLTRIGDNTISQNATNGVQCSVASNPNSYLDNRIKGNSADLSGCNNPMTQAVKN